ncbi:MAG: fasciclin domain-containing protein [Balneolaceae bacterium]|nr:fasciclin domain-containing protein [Balneolaceae bacterium]
MRSFRKALSFLYLLAFLILIVGVQEITAQEGTVMDVIENSNEHTILTNLLHTSEYSRVLSEDGPYTVIAPTDKAFRSMDMNLEELKNNQEKAQDVVVEHLFEGEVAAQDAEVALNLTISQESITASNGIVHITSEVIGRD